MVEKYTVSNILVEIDITDDVCPMTFVRTRIALDRLSVGDRLQVRLRGSEARHNVPKAAVGLGYAIASLLDQADGSTLLVLMRR